MRSFRRQFAAAVAAGASFTALVALNASVSATRNAALHVGVETAASFISALAAVLVYGRYTRSSQRRDLLLTTALAVLAVAGVAFGAVPAMVSGADPAPVAWTGVAARALGAGLLAAAALVRAHEISRPPQTAWHWLAGAALLLTAMTVAATLGAGALPPPVSPGSTPGDAFSGHWLIAGSEVAMIALFGAAAAGFARRAARDDDALLAWLAIGVVFAAFARLNYLIYPSVLTDWFAAGDILRLACLLCVLAGGIGELRRTQAALTAAAVIHERRRIARDLHDGTAQDLAFIVRAGRDLAASPAGDDALERIVSAARHALENTRHAVANLARASEEPLRLALERTVQDVAGREGVHADVEGPVDVSVPPATCEALCLVVREAVSNSIRHGAARRVRLTIENADVLTLTIGDDGRGFDPTHVPQSIGHFGLAGMRQRVADLGGILRVSSVPGEGTELVVMLP